MRALSLATAIAALLAAGCTVHQTEVPPFSGPSGLALSLDVTVTPDSITQDGASQASVLVAVRDANARAMPGVSLRVDTMVGGQLVDFGTLSAKSIVSGTDGRARAVFTAPPAPPAGTPFLGNLVTFMVTATGTDFAASQSSMAQLRLVPAGIIIPPARFVPKFTFTPSLPTQGQGVFFDASSTTNPDNAVLSYSWNFGDGSAGSGRSTTHSFGTSGAFSVTLTVTDQNGLAASTTQGVLVSAGLPPSVDFTFSPSAPGINQAITFVATAQSSAPGHSIVRYDWSFGSGGGQSGQIVTKSYDTAGAYTVTLTVTDDLGLTKSVSKGVTVAALPGGLFADFTYSPTGPSITAGTNSVVFDATPSTSPVAIASYAWDFGDGTPPAAGKNLSHLFTKAATYVVRLTITDANGATATATKNVTISP